MKRTFRVLLPLLFLVPCSSFKTDSILNHAIPLLPNKTLDGRTIDELYYKGHVTIVSFMYIGCLPCMNEISVLNRITDEYAANSQLQVLCVARQMRDQMMEFNSTGKSIFSLTRKALGVDSIRYTIQPACKDAVSKMIKSGTDSVQDINLKRECTTIEEVYNINSFPVILFVDKKGIVRKITTGGPAVKNDAECYNAIKKEIDLLLAE